MPSGRCRQLRVKMGCFFSFDVPKKHVSRLLQEAEPIWKLTLSKVPFFRVSLGTAVTGPDIPSLLCGCPTLYLFACYIFARNNNYVSSGG